MKFCTKQTSNGIDVSGTAKEVYMCNTKSAKQRRPIRCPYSQRDLRHGKYTGGKGLYVTGKSHRNHHCNLFAVISSRESELIQIAKANKNQSTNFD